MKGTVRCIFYLFVQRSKDSGPLKKQNIFVYSKHLKRRILGLLCLMMIRLPIYVEYFHTPCGNKYFVNRTGVENVHIA